MRYLLEGIWTGYRIDQQRVVHREIIRNARRIRRLQKLHRIEFTDKTSLVLGLRLLLPGEKVEEIHRSDKLIQDAERMDLRVVYVTDMIRKEAEPDARRAEARLPGADKTMDAPR